MTDVSDYLHTSYIYLQRDPIVQFCQIAKKNYIYKINSLPLLINRLSFKLRWTLQF
jgi:hypothetical protein